MWVLAYAKSLCAKSYTVFTSTSCIGFSCANLRIRDVEKRMNYLIHIDHFVVYTTTCISALLSIRVIGKRGRERRRVHRVQRAERLEHIKHQENKKRSEPRIEPWRLAGITAHAPYNDVTTLNAIGC